MEHYYAVKATTWNLHISSIIHLISTHIYLCYDVVGPVLSSLQVRPAEYSAFRRHPLRHARVCSRVLLQTAVENLTLLSFLQRALVTAWRRSFRCPRSCWLVALNYANDLVKQSCSSLLPNVVCCFKAMFNYYNIVHK